MCIGMCIGMTELQKQSFGGALQLYLKRGSEFFKFFKKTYFIEHLRWLLELIKPFSTSMELHIFISNTWLKSNKQNLTP